VRMRNNDSCSRYVCVVSTPVKIEKTQKTKNPQIQSKDL
jgi:hypothetical protein